MIQSNAYEKKWSQFAEQPNDHLTRFQLPQLTGGRVDLFEAVFAHSLSGVRRALAGGFDPNESHAGQTALMHAAEFGLGDICRLLLRNGAHVDVVDPYYSQTALHFAVRNLRADACLALMEAGARADIPCTLGGETAADIAHIRGTVEIIRIVLFRRRADNTGALQLLTDSDDDTSVAVGGGLAQPEDEQTEIIQAIKSRMDFKKQASAPYALQVAGAEATGSSISLPPGSSSSSSSEATRNNTIGGRTGGTDDEAGGETCWTAGTRAGKNNVPLEGARYLCFPRRADSVSLGRANTAAITHSPPRETSNQPL